LIVLAYGAPKGANDGERVHDAAVPASGTAAKLLPSGFLQPHHHTVRHGLCHTRAGAAWKTAGVVVKPNGIAL